MISHIESFKCRLHFLVLDIRKFPIFLKKTAQLYATMHRFTDSIVIFEKLLTTMNHDFDIVFNAANVYR